MEPVWRIENSGASLWRIENSGAGVEDREQWSRCGGLRTVEPVWRIENSGAGVED